MGPFFLSYFLQKLANICKIPHNKDVGNIFKNQKKGGGLMAKIMREKTLINKINKIYPGAKATPLAEFYGDETEKGIWFRGSEANCIDGDPMYDYWNMEWANTFGVNPKFDAFIEEHGWHCENYDAGTLMAYPG